MEGGREGKGLAEGGRNRRRDGPRSIQDRAGRGNGRGPGEMRDPAA